MTTEAISAARCHICRRRIGNRRHYVTQEGRELVHAACLEQQWRIAIRDAGKSFTSETSDVRGGAA